MTRIATIHPEGLFEWDQNDETRKKPMRIGEYLFVAILENGQIMESRKFLTSTFKSENELADAAVSWAKANGAQRIVMAGA